MTLLELAKEIAGSDSEPSEILARLSPTTVLTSELEVVLGSKSGGFSPLKVHHLTTADGASLYYLTKGYSEGYTAELYASLETIGTAIGERWEPLTAEESATLQLTRREARSKVRRAIATILETRRDSRSPIPIGASLQGIESYYLDATLGVTLARSVWSDVCATVQADDATQLKL